MDKTNTTRNNFDEYVSSFCNAFDLNKDGDSSLSNSSLSTVGMDNEDFISDFLDCAYIRSKPPMLKSLSWSSTEPSIASERDSYLMPYACQYNNTKATVPYRRPRSATLPSNASPRYLCVDGRNPYKNLKANSSSFNRYYQTRSSSFSSNSSLSPICANLMSIKEAPHQQQRLPSKKKTDESDDESAYSSQSEFDRFHFDLYDERKDIDELSRLFMEPRRARSYTAPPNISITFENGHSKNILMMPEEASASSNVDEDNNDVRNTNKKLKCDNDT